MRHVDLEAAGRLHHTSKATTLADMHPGATFGFRGEALAALQEVGVLSLTARDPETSLTWTKVMHHGRTAALHAAAHSRPAGVSARIQDLFGTLPVRRKALQPAAVLQATRLRVVALALVRPDLAITLVDSSGGETLLQTPGQAADARAAFSRLFGVERARGLHRISTATTSHGLRLSGFISTATHWTPELQVYIEEKRESTKRTRNAVETLICFVRRGRRLPLARARKHLAISNVSHDFLPRFSTFLLLFHSFSQVSVHQRASDPRERHYHGTSIVFWQEPSVLRATLGRSHQRRQWQWYSLWWQNSVSKFFFSASHCLCSQHVALLCPIRRAA